MKLRSTLFLCLAALITASCGSQSAPATPTSPSTPTTTTPAIPAASTPLTLVSPASDDQLGTLRPTLTVTNPASAVSGRTYEFQLADCSDFTLASGSKSNMILAHQDDLEPCRHGVACQSYFIVTQAVSHNLTKLPQMNNEKWEIGCKLTEDFVVRRSKTLPNKK